MVDDRYEIIEQIGTGGMAIVWKARDRTLDRLVAIKRLLPHLASDPSSAERFRHEARAAAALSHPGIVTVFDTAEDDEGPYIVLELVEGPTLADRLRDEGRIDPPETAMIVRDVAAALDHAHAQGVVHRDIKPSNLMIDDHGRVRITDFGIAKTLEDPTEVTQGELIGTVSYMAPEILDGEPASPASDIYSLATVTHEMLTGSPPFQADSVGSLLGAIRAGDLADLSGVPAGMADTVSRAMSRNTAKRPQTAGAFAAALVAGTTLPVPSTQMAAGSGEPTLVMAPSETGSDQTDRRSLPVLLGVSALGLALLIWAATARPNPTETSPPSTAMVTGETTTTVPETPTTSTTTTTSTTSTTTTTVSTTVAETPETIAAAIEESLAAMRPPRFHPRDVSRVEEALRKTMEEWFDDDPEDAAEEWEKMADGVLRLPDSEERDEVIALIIQLAEAIGFDVIYEPDDD